jgi:hypothetical protein
MSSKMSMQNLACTQMDLDTFLTIFEEKFQDFSGKLLSQFKKNPNLSKQFYTQPSKAWACKIPAL